MRNYKMKTKINEDNEVECYRNNDLYLGCFVKIEVSDTMYSWEFKSFEGITLSNNDIDDLQSAFKKLK